MIEIQKCKKCGYELYPLDKVCDKCGTKVDTSVSVAVSPASRNSRTAVSIHNDKITKVPKIDNTSPKVDPVTTEKEKPDKSGLGKKILIGLGIFFGIVLLGVIIFFTVQAISDASYDDEDESISEESGNTEGITIPEDMLYEMGIENDDIDSVVSSGLAKNVTYNDDGSVTLTMTELQKKAALEQIKKEINSTLKEYVDEEYYYGVTKISPNKNFTSYMVYTTYTSRDEYDEMLSSDLFELSQKYATCEGRKLESIHIDLVNKAKKDIYYSFEYSEEYEDDEDTDSSKTPALDSAKPVDSNSDDVSGPVPYIPEEDSQTEYYTSEDESDSYDDSEDSDEEDDDYWEDEDMEDENDDDEEWEDASPDYDDEEDEEDSEGFEDFIVPMEDINDTNTQISM